MQNPAQIAAACDRRNLRFDTPEFYFHWIRMLNRIFYDATSLEQAKMVIADFKLKYRNVYPSAVECLEEEMGGALPLKTDGASEQSEIFL